MATTASSYKSIAISFATQYAELIIQFLGVLILARILSPEDIGVYSIAAFLMTFLHAFRDFGVVQYIIQEQDLTREKIRAAQGVAIILALIIAGILLGSSGFVADFYEKPEIASVLQVMAASFAISPIGSVLVGILRRDMHLAKIFYIKLGSALCHVAVSTTLAFHGFGAQSLAWANFAGILSFGVIASFLKPAGVPRLPKFKNIGKILAFGGTASVGNAANTAGTNLPDLVIGKVLSIGAVGYFSRANGLMQLFNRLISGALLPLALPYFAQLRRQGQDIVPAYLAAIEYLTVLAWPFYSVMLLLAQPLVRTLYGDQWDASIPLVEVLCVAGAINSISLFATQAMIANGQVKFSTKTQVIVHLVRIAAVLAVVHYGLTAIALALIAAELVSVAVTSWYLSRTIKVRPHALVHRCIKSVMVTICTAAGPLLVRIYLIPGNLPSWVLLFSGILAGALGWLLGIWWTNHPIKSKLQAMFRLFPFNKRTLPKS